MWNVGVSNPTSMEQCDSPIGIILPEGMRLTSLVAGSRHTAAITACHKVLYCELCAQLLVHTPIIHMHTHT